MIAALLKYSQLQVSYGINMVAIADGKPQQMGLLDIIAYYVNYQRDVILRRSKFELNEAKEREHILKGLVIAVQNIDEVIKIIKTHLQRPTPKQSCVKPLTFPTSRRRRFWTCVLHASQSWK